MPPPRDELLRRVAGVAGLLALPTDRSTTGSSTRRATDSGWSPTSRSATTTSTSRPARDAGSPWATRPACSPNHRRPRVRADAGGGPPARRRATASSAGAAGGRSGRRPCSGAMSMGRRSGSSGWAASGRRSPGAPPASGCASCTTRGTGSRRTSSASPARPGRRCRPPRGGRLRHAPRQPGRRDPPPDRCPGPRDDAPVGDPREHGARTGRGHRRPRGRPAHRRDPGRGAGRHRPGALPADHPLLGLDNRLVVPHVGSATRVTRGRMAAMSAANLLAGVRGERLPTPVNPEVYDRPA